MNDFLKCACPHCGQSIEYPAGGTGQIVPCPTCEKSVALTSENPPVNFVPNVIPPTAAPVFPSTQAETTTVSEKWIYTYTDGYTYTPASIRSKKQKRQASPRLSQLSEETIRVKSRGGNIPLHLAATIGKIDLIPRHLLNVELFMDRNNAGNTPLHLAAKHGTLNQVPRQFLTKETLTVSNRTWITGSGYQAHGDTVLHTAAFNGHFDQIPKEFMTIEFLKIEATGYRNTVLQYLLMSNSLDVIPGIYTNSALLDYKNSRGWTLRLEIEAKREREACVARVRSEPATEKQKEKLRYFGYAFDENITKGQASDALDKCVRDFPEVNQAYYNRPATEEQKAKLRSKSGGALTYGKAKDLISQNEMARRHKDRLDELKENKIPLFVLSLVFYRGQVCRHFTIGRVKKAVKELDAIATGWKEDRNRDAILLQKAAELYPEWAEKERWC